MSVTMDQVKELRERTGAGMVDCKKALVEKQGDVEEAIKYLREKGIAKAAKRAGRETKEGLVHAYIHPGGRIGVLVEINCETDFVARNEEFQSMVNDIAMHIAASAPLYVRREDVPEDVVAAERETLVRQAAESGKPANVIEKMVDGRVNKFFGEICLLEQPFVKDPEGKRTVEDVLKEMIAKVGENLSVRRFSRFALGER